MKGTGPMAPAFRRLQADNRMRSAWMGVQHALSDRQAMCAILGVGWGTTGRFALRTLYGLQVALQDCFRGTSGLLKRQPLAPAPKRNARGLQALRIPAIRSLLVKGPSPMNHRSLRPAQPGNYAPHSSRCRCTGVSSMTWGLGRKLRANQCCSAAS